ncbi:transposase, partial [Candidatus Falkowbacteria bacterium]|nr:transposase [Candidatus Falkowbacteria bacterium]
MYCGGKHVIKWGKQNNKQRWFCKNCGKLFIWKIKINSLARQKIWFKKWIISRRTLQDLSDESGKSIDTLRRLFQYFLNNTPIIKIKSNNNCHLIIDGTYTSDFCILNYLDNDLKYLQFYNIVERENYNNYVADLELLKQSGLDIVSITSDGQKGLIKAINRVFPNVIHQ